MAPPDIPAQVLRFIDERIDSVAQLETLLMMHAEPARDWAPADVAARNYVPLEEALRVLEALHRRQLVAPGPGATFRISFADDQSRALIDAVARTYRANLVRIATYIHERPPASLKEFARAFDLKKDR